MLSLNSIFSYIDWTQRPARCSSLQQFMMEYGMTDTQLYIAKRDYLKLSSIAALDFSLYDTTHKTNRGTVFTPGTLIGIFRDETDGTTTPLTSLFICRALSGKRWLTQREVETLYLVS